MSLWAHLASHYRDRHLRLARAPVIVASRSPVAFCCPNHGAASPIQESCAATTQLKGYPADAQQHQECLADFDDVADALNPLDSAFFEYPEPLADLVNEYLAVKH